MKYLILIASYTFFFQASSQTKIEEDSLYIHKVIFSPSHGEFKKIKVEKNNYNYFEIDSLGNYAVLGNVDRYGKPNGLWKFYLGDVTRNGKTDWSIGNVMDGKLEGKWLYSWICVRYYEAGKDHNPNPCPNI